MPIRSSSPAARRALLCSLLLCALPLAAGAQGTPQPRPPLKVAFVYVGPVGDAGWTHAHDTARLALDKEFGARVRTQMVEAVQEGAGAERVFRDLAEQGNQLIFGTSFGYAPTMLRVAAEFPDVKFEHATGFQTARNLRTYDVRGDEPAYLAGIVAGAMTRSNTVGVVGAYPTPGVIRVINALALGALSSNPKVTVKVIWIHEWFSPPRETEAAKALVNGGADVLMQTTDSPAVLQLAERTGTYAFGLQSDMRSFGPTAHLGSATVNWLPYYAKAVRETLDGTWKTGHAWWGIKEGAVDLIGVPDKVPAAARARVDAVREGLRRGQFHIWQGPMTDNQGKPVLAAGQVADDKFLLGMQFYVKGVEGRIPTGPK